MSVTSIRKNDPGIANRYLADQLSEAERDAFEAQLTSDPKILRELEATARLKTGLEKLRASGQLDTLVDERRSRTPWLMSAAAAAAILVVAIGMLRWKEDSSPALAANLSALVNEHGHVLSLGTTYAVFRKRGGNYDAVVRLPETRQAIELRVLPELDESESPYNVSLARVASNNGDATHSFSVGNLLPAADGFISIFVDSAQVSEGDYALDVTGSGAKTVARTSFKIRLTSK